MRVVRAPFAAVALVLMAPLWFAYILVPDLLVRGERAGGVVRAVIGTPVLTVVAYFLRRDLVGWLG